LMTYSSVARKVPYPMAQRSLPPCRKAVYISQANREIRNSTLNAARARIRG
jgi:hypothetical protein